MKSFYSKVIALFSIAVICTTAAEATPAFARQMNADCMTCHYQNIPKLNTFGREFKLSGFTMTGGITELTSKAVGGLDLPSNLNMGFVIKARYHDVSNNEGISGASKTSTEVFDEAAFIFGGKISQNVGTSMEFIEGLAGGKIIFSKPMDFGRVGAAIFMTDGLGVFSGLEPYSTGLYRPIRQFENRKGANIFQKLGIGDGAAQGVQAYYSGNGVFATVGQYVPVYGASTETTESGHKLFARIAYELDVSGFNVAIGGYYIGGDVKDNNATEGVGKVVLADEDAYDRESTGFDLQVQGDVGKMSLMITGGYVLSNEYTSAGAIGVSKDSDKNGFSLGAQLNPIDALGVKVGYLSYTDNNNANNDSSTIAIGTDYNAAQNIRLVLEYSMTDFSAAGTTAQNDLYLMTHLAF